MLLFMSSWLILILGEREQNITQPVKVVECIYARQAEDHQVRLFFPFFTKAILITGNSIWKADFSLCVTPIIYLLF